MRIGGASAGTAGLTSATSQVSRSSQQLASGSRITRAADDAAGLVASEGLRAEIGGLQTAARNTQDGIALTRTADAALGEATQTLQRMRELALSAANATSSGSAEQAEVSQLQDSLDRLGTDTSFAGRQVFDGVDATLQTGGDGGDTTTVSTGTLSAADLGVDGVDLTADPQQALQDIDAALEQVTAQRSALGAQENGLASKARNLGQGAENGIASESRIRDLDMAAGATQRTGDLLRQNFAMAMQAQANQSSGNLLQLLR